MICLGSVKEDSTLIYIYISVECSSTNPRQIINRLVLKKIRTEANIYYKIQEESH